MNYMNNFIINIAMWIHGGSEPMPGDIILAVIIVFMLIIVFVAFIFALIRSYNTSTTFKWCCKTSNYVNIANCANSGSNINKK